MDGRDQEVTAGPRRELYKAGEDNRDHRGMMGTKRV